MTAVGNLKINYLDPNILVERLPKQFIYSIKFYNHIWTITATKENKIKIFMIKQIVNLEKSTFNEQVYIQFVNKCFFNNTPSVYKWKLLVSDYDAIIKKINSYYNQKFYLLNDIKTSLNFLFEMKYSQYF
jgi:hypothetical protein